MVEEIDKLINKLLLSDNAKERASAANALGWKGNATALTPLSRTAKNKKEDAFVRQYAIIALGRLEDVRAIETFAKILEGEKDERARGNAKIALQTLRLRLEKKGKLAGTPEKPEKATLEERELYALKLINPTNYLKAFLKLRNHLKMMIKKPEEWEKHAEELKRESK